MFSRCHRLVLGLDDSSTDSLLFRDGLREHVSTVSESAKTFFLGGGGGGDLSVWLRARLFCPIC